MTTGTSKHNILRHLRATTFTIVAAVLLLATLQVQAADGDQGNDVALNLTPIGSGAMRQAPNPDLLFSPPNALERKAYQNVTRKAMPLTPNQIHQMKQMLAATQQAASADATIPPKPVTSSMMVSLAPGATPPVISLQKGFITSLVFVDASGNEWPIEGYDLGNPSAFNIEWQAKSNTLLVQANSLYTYGNLAVRLKGISTPVMLTLIPGQTTVDYRVDLHVQGQSPDAISPMSDGMPNPASNTLLGVLNGIPPTKARALQVTGAGCVEDLNNCQAWLYEGRLYLRIPSPVLSPSWTSSMQSSDGVHAYEMMQTPNVLVSYHGQPMQMSIEGY